MTLQELLSLPLNETVSVFNQPFEYVGRAEITLDDGSKMYWLFNDEDGMLSVAPDEEELITFDHLEDEVEADDSIFLHGKEYEFSYEGAGKITSSDGETDMELDDRYLFSEYESSDGEKLRIISNENTGETDSYLGRIVSEDDLNEI
ncbi:DUF4178 domain-containing protein [Candidatus Uhrbacteria bacterium]|nr:DUF4178 domain-containing protein [Candidatus Uhrbacteria bacterium]